MNSIGRDIAAPARPRIGAGIFTAAIFLSAALLFFVQPLFARIVLPVLGGAPAVWTTAMLFFQVVLIGGYLYAHLATRFLRPAMQLILHGLLFACALAFLPLGLPEGWSYDPTGSTVRQSLVLFALGVGVPFAFLSANAPLIQAWYVRSGGRSAEDPYFLYGASNLGSFAALLGFPLIAEPLFGATEIGRAWAAGFMALGLLLAAAGHLAIRGEASGLRQRRENSGGETAPALPAGEIGWWLLLAFIPSSLMLAVTTRISTDLGAFPLLWVVPLSLYLLTFVLAFTNRPLLPDRLLDLLFLAGFVIMAGLAIAPDFTVTVPILVLLLAGQFVISLKAHRRLYARRPHNRYLTLFYLAMSVGGAIGGIFNSLVAPEIFDSLLEGAVTVALASVLFGVWDRRMPLRGIAIGLGVGVVVLLPFLLSQWDGWNPDRKIVLLATTALLGMSLVVLKGQGLACLALCCTVIGVMAAMPEGTALFRDRSFFGAHSVKEDARFRLYANGTTIHGAQWIEDLDAVRPRPIYYYHSDAPMARILNSGLVGDTAAIGIVGLGVGSLACYARPGQDWHFYEIDAMVDAIARNPDLFTFLSRCTPDAPTHLGDARVVLRKQDLRFDLLVIDAYSSDAVPVHLTTAEAVALYRERLRPGGLLLFHISNRYYDISRPLGRAAAALGLSGRIQHYRGGAGGMPDGATASSVVVMSESAEVLERLPGGGDLWTPLTSDGGRLWTDDYSNPISILR